MAPTINSGDMGFVDPHHYKHASVQRGEIVVVIDPDGKTDGTGQAEMYTKRVIGLAGDKVQISGGKVYVNDRVLDGILGSGKYQANFPVDDFGPVTVAKNTYFLVGDNLPDSIDSRHWKNGVTIEGIYGRITTIQDGKTGKTRYF